MSSQKYKLDQVFGGREPPAMAEDLRWMGRKRAIFFYSVRFSAAHPV